MGSEKKNDLKKVKELIELMLEKDLVEVELCSGDNKIHLKRPGAASGQITGYPAAIPVASAAAPAVPADSASSVDDGFTDIPSPIVGTFYSAPSPEAAPFVKVGDTVTPDTVVCIVEAMKVMNEIKAEKSGTIEKILVTNGQAVEFAQPLFKLKS